VHASGTSTALTILGTDNDSNDCCPSGTIASRPHLATLRRLVQVVMTTAFDSARDCAQRYPWSVAVILIIRLPSTCLLINRAAATGAVLHIGSTTSPPSRPSLPGLSSLYSNHDPRNFSEIFAPLCKPGKLVEASSYALPPPQLSYILLSPRD
jgi:hypothetical protein